MGQSRFGGEGENGRFLPPPLPIRHKVFAYITHGQRLLLFRHVHFPEAGIQVPAGTLEPSETPAAGVMREAWEETGLTNLELVACLGEQQRDMSDFGRAEIHQRTFFHLRCHSQPPDQWQHEEKLAADNTSPILFAFFWAKLPHEVPPLIADHDFMLPQLWRFVENS